MYGFNILASQTQVPLDEIRRLNAPFHLIITDPVDGVNHSSDLNRIAEIKFELAPAQLIWRTQKPHRPTSDFSIENSDIVKRWQLEGHRDVIRDDPLHEPHLPINDVALHIAYVKSRVDLLQRATDAGFRVAIGSFAVGTPNSLFVASGIYDDLIRAVVNGDHLISYHGYSSGIPGAGEKFPFSALKEPELATKLMHNTGRWDLSDDHLHLRRTDQFVSRAFHLGIKEPSVVLTEGGFDNLLSGELYNFLRQSYGIGEYNKDLKGVLSWKRYFEHAFPEKTFEKVLETLLIYMRDNVFYPSYIKGVCLFAINPNLELPAGQNWGNTMLDSFRRDILPVINQITRGDSVVTMLSNQAVFITAGANFRKRPGITQPRIRRLEEGTYHASFDPVTFDIDGYTWRRIILDGTEGYIAEQMIQWIEFPQSHEVTAIPALNFQGNPAVLAGLSNYISNAVGLIEAAMKAGNIEDTLALMRNFSTVLQSSAEKDPVKIE